MDVLETIGGPGIGPTTRTDAGQPAQAPRSGDQAPSSPIFPVLLNDKQAAASLGVSVRKFHELRAQPWMPCAVVLGPRALRWVRAEMEQAAAVSMPRLQAASEPAQLLRARIERMKRGAGVPA
jgi:predicted DNA-binding transcriptional regulator AlpA